MKINRIWLGAAILWCIAIFFATASPSATGGSTHLFFEKFLQLSESQTAFLNVIFRKSVHLSAFGLLAVLFYYGIGKKFLIAWIVTTVYAATDELHQVFLPDRTGAVTDVFIDSIGAILALCIIKLLEIFIRKRSSERRGR